MCAIYSVLQPGVWGDPANWNSSNIQEAAVIVEGLSLAEINQMSFDLNAASKLGEFDVWSDDKVLIKYILCAFILKL